MQADQKQITRLLKTAVGQLNGILKMVEEDRYCIDISNQLMAAQSILSKANAEILKAHMQCCVRSAVEAGDAEEKLEEISVLLDKLAKG
ncbi:MAG: metal-sensing transcriptional repressor [Candidatus Onthomonas sp.]|nr:metal-sensing transcriptional repressor [Candidatus Onthomonas sp.]